MYMIETLERMLVGVLERIPELDLVISTVLLTKKVSVAHCWHAAV
jgi:hypothetical protein